MITGLQIRMARQALRWTASDLAKHSGVGLRTVKRIESEDGPPKSSVTTLEKVRKAFEAVGIEFIGTPEDRPGVRVNVS